MQKPKACDWICAECKNVNYSFRKICNRCQQCYRNAPGNYFIPNQSDPTYQMLETLKLNENDLTGSNHSNQSSTDSNDEDDGVFSHALFLQDLQKKTNISKGFSFMKQCPTCFTQNYFYQQKCCNCGLNSF